VSRYQKGKTNLDFNEAKDSEWQWHQLGHMQVCTSLQTNNHASTPPLRFLQAECPSCRPTNNSKPVGNSFARQAHMVMQTDEKVENTTPLPHLQDGQEHKMTSGIYHQCALYLIRSRNMTSICSLVDGRVSQHGRNVLILAIEMSRHNPSLRKPDLTSKVEHTIGMLHLAQLLQ